MILKREENNEDILWESLDINKDKAKRITKYILHTSRKYRNKNDKQMKIIAKVQNEFRFSRKIATRTTESTRTISTTITATIIITKPTPDDMNTLKLMREFLTHANEVYGNLDK